jgi:hypothetical protein
MPTDTFEHRLLVEFIGEAGGRAYLEVPVSGPGITRGSRVRKIDAVRFPSAKPSKCLDFDRAGLMDDLQSARESGATVELIEAKNAASRYTIGQAIAGGDLFNETYGDVHDLRLAVLYPSTRIDVALDRVCQRRGIRVYHRPPPASPTSF